MITAHSEDVKLPPGKYQIATVIKAKIRAGIWKSHTPITSGKRPYKRVRPNQKTRCEREAERYLLDAAIEDPDELQEFWIRPAEELQC